MIELEKEKMDSVRALAETNIQVSQAKTLLFKMKEEEKQYIAEREAVALNSIQKIFDESSEVIKSVRSNYQEVNDILKESRELTKFLTEIHNNFIKLLEEFEKAKLVWNDQVSNVENEFNSIKKEIKIDQITIINDKKSIEKQKVLLIEEQRKINDQRGTLERAVERLKKGRL